MTRRMQILSVKIVYDDNACDEETILSDTCCTAGECEDTVCSPVDENNNNELLWSLDEFAEHSFEILQASPDREV